MAVIENMWITDDALAGHLRTTWRLPVSMAEIEIRSDRFAGWTNHELLWATPSGQSSISLAFLELGADSYGIARPLYWDAGDGIGLMNWTEAGQLVGGSEPVAVGLLGNNEAARNATDTWVGGASVYRTVDATGNPTLFEDYACGRA